MWILAYKIDQFVWSPAYLKHRLRRPHVRRATIHVGGSVAELRENARWGSLPVRHPNRSSTPELFFAMVSPNRSAAPQLISEIVCPNRILRFRN